MASPEHLVQLLKRYKNLVLEGAPGTGKTFVVSQIADAWDAVTGRVLAGRGEGAYAITFHPSTSYEDFVEGLRIKDNEE